MSSPQNEGQRCSINDAVAVQNSPVRAESDLGGASHSPRGDLPGDQVPCDPARTDCPHRARQDSSVRQFTASTQTDKPGALLGPCSNCLSITSASSAHGTSPGLRQPSDGDRSASMAQPVSGGPPPLCTRVTIAQPAGVQAIKSSVDANVTRSASTARPPSDVGTPQTTLGTSQAGLSNTSGETSTLEESNSGSPDTSSTQMDEGLHRALSPQRAPSTDDSATGTIARSAVTDEQVPQRGFNPGVLAGISHSNAVEPWRQQSPATTTSRAGSSQRSDIQPSAQQQARLGTSSAYPTHVRVPNASVASIASPFDRPSPNLDFYLEYLASQYPVDSGASENLVYPYAQYFHTS